MLRKGIWPRNRAARNAESEVGRPERWRERLAHWLASICDFCAEGLHERFPAQGQVKPVARLQRQRGRLAGPDLPAAGRKKSTGGAP
jgi:hypothetical protein